MKRIFNRRFVSILYALTCFSTITSYSTDCFALLCGNDNFKESKIIWSNGTQMILHADWYDSGVGRPAWCDGTGYASFLPAGTTYYIFGYGSGATETQIKTYCDGRIETIITPVWLGWTSMGLSDPCFAETTVSHCDCPCTDGQTRPCYDGPVGSQDVGICHAGTQTCTNGEWNVPCVGEVLPQQETCDNKDNNCNGQIDEGFECTFGQTQSCYDGPAGTEGIGICHGGTQGCINCQWDTTYCSGEVLPDQEKCDGKDHNCNGQADESCDPCADQSGQNTTGHP